MKKPDLSEYTFFHPDSKRVIFFSLALSFATVLIYSLVVRFMLNSASPDEDMYSSFEYVMEAGLMIGVGSAGVSVLSGFFASYFKNRSLKLYRKFNSFHFEIRYVVFPAIIFGAMILILNLYYLMHPTNVDAITPIVNWPYSLEYYFIVFPMCFLSVLYLHLAAFSVKTALKEGFIETLFAKTLFGNFVLFISQRIRRFFDSRELGRLSNGTYIFYLMGGIFLLFLIQGALKNAYLSVIILSAITLFLYLKSLILRQRADFLKRETERIVMGDYKASIDKNLGMLNPLAESINQIQEGLKHAVAEEVKSTKSKTELITNISHDLKTPLTSILSYSDLITREDISEDKIKKYAEIIHQKSLRLKTLIDDLFEMTKMTAGNIELHKTPLNLLELFMQSLAEHRETLSEKNLEVVVSDFSGVIYAELDGEKTFRVFDNIFGNLEKYALNSTRIYIDLSYDPVRNRMSFVFKNVANYEMKVNPEELTNRFTRGDSSRRTEGSGLGLAIAKSLLELQGATMQIEIDGDLFKTRLQFPTTRSIIGGNVLMGA